jgi:hypothetical protein
MIYGVDYETRTMNGLPIESAKPEPTVCDACGEPVETLFPCVWDDSLMVGLCCESYVEHRCPACNSDNLDFGAAAIECRDCGCITTEEACEIKMGPFALTSPTQMPRLDQIRIRPVRVTAAEFRRNVLA